MQNATVTWPSRPRDASVSEERAPFQLTDMSFEIPGEAKFVLVCGSIGSGKVSCFSRLDKKDTPRLTTAIHHSTPDTARKRLDPIYYLSV